MSSQSKKSNIIQMHSSPKYKPSTPEVKALVKRLKKMRNLSLGLGVLGSSLLLRNQYKPLGHWIVSTASTVAALSLTTAATTQFVIHLNKQLDENLNPTQETSDPV